MVQLKKEKETIALIDSYVQKFDDKDNAFNSLILSIKGDCLMQDSVKFPGVEILKYPAVLEMEFLKR